VVLSVLAHGMSARPFARVYGEHMARLGGDRPEHAEVPHLASRPLPGGATPSDR
jgi:hypothetical protein